MSSQDQCREPFPGDGEVKCRQKKGHDGNHSAEAEVVPEKSQRDKPWPKIRWEWNGEKIISQPGASSVQDDEGILNYDYWPPIPMAMPRCFAYMKPSCGRGYWRIP